MSAAVATFDPETGVTVYRSGDVESTVACAVCGTAIVPKNPLQRACGSSCRERLRATRPDRIAASRERNRVWAKEHRGVVKRQPWLLGPPPSREYLPGGGCEIALSPTPQWPIEHRNVRALHGMLTVMMASQHGRWPAFSVVPWPRGCGWAVYSRVDEEIARVAGRRVEGILFDREITATFSPLARVKAPTVSKRGRQRVRIDTVTPVIIRSTGGFVQHTEPTTQNLTSTLTIEFPSRVGVTLDDDALRLEVVEKDTHLETVFLGGKYGSVRGWVGHVVVEVNAVGRWLLEAAARGPGLGGRTAFGFGRVRVAPC